MLYEDMSASAFRVLLRFLYAGELPAWDVGGGGGGESGGGSGGPCGSAGGAGRGASRRVASAGCKRKGGKNGTGGKGGGKAIAEEDEDEEEGARESLVQELLRVADRFQAGGLYEHCLAEFGRALTVETAIQQLLWAHAHAPEGARAVAMEYVVANCRAIRVSCVRAGHGVLLAARIRGGFRRCVSGACASCVW